MKHMSSLWIKAQKNNKHGLFHLIFVSCLLFGQKCYMFANMQTFISGGKAGNEKNSFFAYICYRKHIWNIEMRVKPYERVWKVIVIALIVKVHEPVWIVQRKKASAYTISNHSSTNKKISHVSIFLRPCHTRCIVFTSDLTISVSWKIALRWNWILVRWSYVIIDHWSLNDFDID